MNDVTRIWNGLPQDALAQIPPLLEATSLAELRAITAIWQQARIARQDEQLRHRLDQLETQGIVLPGLRPNWRERLGMAWDDMLARFRPDDPATVQIAELPLAETHPMDELPFDYDEIEPEIARFRDQITELITAAHGRAPLKIALPDRAYDLLYEEQLDDAALQLMDIQFITAYWPPLAERPGLAISDRQEDGGLPREISLQARNEAAHKALANILESFGGRLE